MCTYITLLELKNKDNYNYLKQSHIVILNFSKKYILIRFDRHTYGFISRGWVSDGRIFIFEWLFQNLCFFNFHCGRIAPSLWKTSKRCQHEKSMCKRNIIKLKWICHKSASTLCRAVLQSGPHTKTNTLWAVTQPAVFF